MSDFFDESKWERAITRPDWYIELYPELQAMRGVWESDPDREEVKQQKTAVRGFFESALNDYRVTLGQNGPNWDKERQPIDTVVIHHTSADPGYRLPYMNAVQLLNVYVSYYNNPTAADASIKGQPIWSNHTKGGRQVFYLYHWLVRMDGTVERLLEDEQIGWHSGNWDTNCRSVGICLDNDYESQNPSQLVLKSMAELINSHYSQVRQNRVIGHREAGKNTICPGDNFVGGWKQTLLELINV